MSDAAAAGEEEFHGGRLLARRLAAHGVSTVFTLSGGHLFSVYDGCRAEGIALVDTRHEQTAAFAAEGHAKATRQLGVCALTAGPGVTNGMSAIASAAQNDSPLLVIAGRAPAMRWGQGSLQEIDHVPFVRPLVKFAATAESTAEIPGLIDEAVAAALRPPFGPAFVDLPLDHVFGTAREPVPAADTERLRPEVDPVALRRAAAQLADAERPVVMAGTGLYWGGGETALRALVEALEIPVFLNGLGRGCLPADHPLAFSRARSLALREADVALVLGVPLDFRLGFGRAFADDAELILAAAAEPERDPPRRVSAELYGSLPGILDSLRDAAAAPAGAAASRGAADRDGSGTRRAWLDRLAEAEASGRAKETAGLTDDRAPLHPMRVYAEIAPLLDRDAIVVGDGGDFVSFAGRLVDSFAPGCWLDPGPYGCLGSGPGYALAAGLARPGRQVVLFGGDGAFGFSGIEFDTLVRHGVPIVAVLGNNGIWALEKHPMEAIYGYSVVADLQPELRYDRVVEALGGHGELVRTPAELRPAFERALASGKPALVNVLTDPTVAYPRRSNLA